MTGWIDWITQRIRQSIPEKQVLVRATKNAVLLTVIFIALYIVGTFMPVGFDWGIFFSKGRFPEFWMPWTAPVVALFNYPAIFAITILSLGLRLYRYQPRSLPILLAIISLPTLWMFFLGNVDGLALFGLLILPWGAPLVLIKPQIASFALLAKRKTLMIAVAWLLLSFVFWGFWVQTWGRIFTTEWKTEWVQDISLFPWGLLLALPLMWFSWADEDLLMAAGSLASPHLFPYHFMVLMPALARMNYPWMIATWLISFSPLLSNWLGDWAWHFGNLMSIFFWFGIFFSLPLDVRRQRITQAKQQWKEFFKL